MDAPLTLEIAVSLAQDANILHFATRVFLAPAEPPAVVRCFAFLVAFLTGGQRHLGETVTAVPGTFLVDSF